MSPVSGVFVYTILGWLRPRAVADQPIADIVIEIPRIPDPAGLGNMMPGRRRDATVGRCVRDWAQKLRTDPAVFCSGIFLRFVGGPPPARVNSPHPPLRITHNRI